VGAADDYPVGATDPELMLINPKPLAMRLPRGFTVKLAKTILF
jgi:hypothetical protein